MHLVGVVGWALFRAQGDGAPGWRGGVDIVQLVVVVGWALFQRKGDGAPGCDDDLPIRYNRSPCTGQGINDGSQYECALIEGTSRDSGDRHARLSLSFSPLIRFNGTI